MPDTFGAHFARSTEHLLRRLLSLFTCSREPHQNQKTSGYQEVEIGVFSPVFKVFEITIKLYDRIGQKLTRVRELIIAIKGFRRVSFDYKPVSVLSPPFSVCILLRFAILVSDHFEIWSSRGEQKMRKREAELFIGKLDEIEYEKCGGSLYLRLLESDEKKIVDLAKLSGEKRSVIAQKLIHAALSNDKINLGAGKLESKVDALIKSESESRFFLESILDRYHDLDERVGSIEEKVDISEESTRRSTTILREVYCMLNIAVSSLDLTFSKLLEYTSPNDLERTNSGLVAETVMAKLLAHSMRDLARCFTFHSIDFDDDLARELYIATKMKI